MYPDKSRWGMFCNPHHRHIPRGFTHYMLWCLGYYKDAHALEPIPEGFAFPNPNVTLQEDQPMISWIGHSTFSIHAKGKHFLLDPIWNDRCSPLPFLGPKRHVPPPIAINQLSPVDYVIISHDHYDHFDKPTVQALYKRFPQIKWVVPLGMRAILRRYLPRVPHDNIFELEWWESAEHEGITFTAVPAQHFSGRGLFDRNRTLWMGCIVELGPKKRFYFVGDTGYNPIDFKAIGGLFSPIDLSIIPIGVYVPRRFMSAVHVNPKESIEIHREVGSNLSVGGHFGTYKLSQDSLYQPPYDLYRYMKKEKIPFEQFRVLTPGQRMNW